MRIDSHHHLWRLSRGDYAWLRADDPALAPLARDFVPADFAPLRRAHDIDRTVLVQAADTTAETEFLLALAARDDSIGAVVGWVDLGRADAVTTLEAFARHPKFKGVRPMLQDLPDVDWIARAPRPEAVQALVDLGLRFDALVKPAHLPALLRFLHVWPDLPVVIDHAAKPAIAQGWDGAWAPAWRRHLAELATLPQVHGKFSGLLTELAPAQRATRESTIEAVRPAWDALCEAFGPSRLMWGSDWPVLALAGDLSGWVDVASTFIDALPAADRAQVWHGTARRFYALDAT
jgi:L-fuconolactonase